MKKQIRVLVIDDSILMINVITEMLNSDSRLCVVGSARNGKEGMEKVISLKPDVATLDMEMPVMNGIDFLKNCMKRHPIPIVMLSAYTRAGAEETIEALSLGAVDFVAKPSGSISLNLRDVRNELIEKVIHASGVGKKKLLTPILSGSQSIEYPPHPTKPRIVTICSSTGGPRALGVILLALPKNLPGCILIIQHMPEQFTSLLAKRLNRISPLDVRESKGGELLRNGRIYVAPGGKHLEVSKKGRIILTNKPKKNSVRPSCDVTLKSLAKFGERFLTVILTGMGRDGADGLCEVKKVDGKVIVEDESTSIIFGMPKAAIKTGYVDKVVPLYGIAKEIINFTR